MENIESRIIAALKKLKKEEVVDIADLTWNVAIDSAISNVRTVYKMGSWIDYINEGVPGYPDTDFAEYFEKNGEYPTYLVLIENATEATVVQYDGYDFIFDDGNDYKVLYWQPLPSIPELLKEAK